MTQSFAFPTTLYLQPGELQALSDVDIDPGAPQDGYPLVWNNATAKWVSDSLTPIWPATPTGPQVIRQLRQWRSPFRASATRSALGATLTGSNKWIGGVLGSDGKIYGIPYNATDILIIDPVAGTATRSALGATLTGSDKWYGGVLGSDGKIYGIPLNATDILIIDPVAGTATRSALGATLTDSNKWIGGVLGSDGKIYGIPYNATDILIIDPVAGTATRSALGATLTDSFKWFGGVLGSDGKIYGIPYNATDILIIGNQSKLFENNLTLSPYLNKF